MSPMRPGFRLDGRRIAFVLCLLALFAYEGYALFVREVGATSHLPPAREIGLTREVNATTPALQQTFVSHADGFHGIDLFPRRSDQAPAGPLEVVVSALERNQGDRYLPVGRARFDASAIDLESFLRVQVPRIDVSAGLNLRVEITMPEAPPGRGLRFEAGGPTYVQGRLMFGDRPEWGDLKFRTLAQRTTVLRHIQHLRTTLPPIMQTDVFWLTVLVVINGALATVIYALGFAGDSAEKGSVAGTADQPRV
jgi:hypothetical protein